MTDAQEQKVYTQLNGMLEVTNGKTIKNMLIALLIAKAQKLGQKEKEDAIRDAYNLA